MSNKILKIISIADGKVITTLNPADIEDEVIGFVNQTVNDKHKIFVAYKSSLLREYIWKESTIELKRTWKSLHIGPITYMACDEANLLATGGSDSIVKLWDTERQYCTNHLKDCVGVITCIAFKPCSKYHNLNLVLAVGGHNNIINAWDLTTNQLVGQLIGHCSTVIGIYFFNEHENKKTLALTGSRDKLAIVWSLNDYSSLRSIPLFESIESIILLPSKFKTNCIDKDKVKGRIFLTGGEKGVVKAWDTKTGSLLFTQTNSILTLEKTETDKEVRNQAISQLLLLSNNQIVVVSFEQNILIYDLEDFNLFKQLIGNNDEVSDIKFLGSNEDHLLVSTNSPNIKIFNTKTLSCVIVKGHTDIVLCLQVYRTDPFIFASSSKDNSVRVWRFNPESVNAVCLFIGNGHSLSVTSLAASIRSSKWLFSGSKDTTLKVWKIPTISSLLSPSSSSEKPHQLSTLSTAKAHEKDINCIDVSPNDKFICTGSQDKTSKIWAFDKRLSLIGVLKGHKKGIWCVAFSPIDQIVATSSADATIKIWSLSDFSCVKTFQGHDCSVLKILFLNRGTQLISSSSDGNIKLWTVKSNESTVTYDAHSDKIWALALTKDEKYLVSGSDDSVIILWKDDTQEKQEERLTKEKLLIENEQKLSNLIFSKKWRQALKLAIMLDQPVKALAIIKQVLLFGREDGEGEESGGEMRLNLLLESLRSFREDQLVCLLEYASKWNTNSKHCEAAQSVLNVLFQLLGIEKMLSLSQEKDCLVNLLPYTERHLNRMDKISRQVNLINFLWSNMKLT